MRVVLLADIHANLDALLAVLDEISRIRPDLVLCLGDIVGYGAEPRQCVEEVRSRGISAIAGNHDFAVVGRCELSYFNDEARQSVLWTREALGQEERSYLGALPLTYEGEAFRAVHGSFNLPEAFEYVLNPAQAYASLQSLGRGLGFIAHSHIPLSFVKNGGLISPTLDRRIQLAEGEVALVNVGSVGQPRDADPRACFALLDTERRCVELRRVEYDVERAAEKILAAGLPPMNAFRLYLGR